MKKIWRIYGDGPKADENPAIILNEYAKQVSSDTEKMFAGIVTESVKEDSGEVSYALYIVAPQLKDYMYRLIEVTLESLIQPYPLELKLFAKDPKNHRRFTCENVVEFRNKLEEVIQSSVTGAILMHLKTLIEIKKEYQTID